MLELIALGLSEGKQEIIGDKDNNFEQCEKSVTHYIFYIFFATEKN